MVNCWVIIHSFNKLSGRVQGKIIPKFKGMTSKAREQLGVDYCPLTSDEE